MPTTRSIPDPVAEPTISVKRAAEILGVSLRLAYSAVERQEMPAVRVGRRFVVPTARFLAHYHLNQPDASADA